jgi:hypothetical protein
LEHPAATSLLSLARISKSFVVNHMPNTPVGNDYVNITSSIKGQLSFTLKPKLPSRATTGGIPPPKKMVPFFRKKGKNSRALSMFPLRPQAKFEQGAGSLAERTRESEIAYASVKIRPFSLASDPAGRSRKANSLTRIYSGRRRNKKAQ